jgi:hypothetical protein
MEKNKHSSTNSKGKTKASRSGGEALNRGIMESMLQLLGERDAKRGAPKPPPPPPTKRKLLEDLVDEGSFHYKTTTKFITPVIKGHSIFGKGWFDSWFSRREVRTQNTIHVCDTPLNTGAQLLELLKNATMLAGGALFWNTPLLNNIRSVFSAMMAGYFTASSPHVVLSILGNLFTRGGNTAMASYILTLFNTIKLALVASYIYSMSATCLDVVTAPASLALGLVSTKSSLFYEIVEVVDVEPVIVPSFDEETVQVSRQIMICQPFMKYETPFGNLNTRMPQRLIEYGELKELGFFKTQSISYKLLPELLNQKTLLATMKTDPIQEIHRLVRLAESCGTAQDEFNEMLAGRSLYKDTVRFSLMKVLNTPSVPPLN